MAVRIRRRDDGLLGNLLREGYVHVPADGTSRAAAEALAPVLERDAERLVPLEDEFRVYALGHVRQYPPHDHPAVAELSGLVAIRRLAKAVFGTYYVHDVLVHSILPGASSQPVHADSGPLWPGLRDTNPPFMFGVNIAVQRTDEVNGCLELWPRTHTGARWEDFDTDSLAIKPEVRNRASRRVRPIRVPMEVGDVLIRDERLWHRGMPNHSGRIRPMVWILVAPWWYRPDGELRVTQRVRDRFAALDLDVDCTVDDDPNYLRLPANAGEGT